ncbi:hypothetical protein [Actinoplanes regularis]|uniref:hypothetical protein n=1 Tax=Actinoplanes regularis TaxID=52697 RepID=UPI00249FD063|nr:hypothetical protein [Actinoplanes regularis]GLW34504.1 hypothetical protein Areg01_74410 [Actinoplanes regularis]
MTADLTGPKARREFLSAVPAVFQTAAMLDENRVDYPGPWATSTILWRRRVHSGRLTLDRRGWEAQATIGVEEDRYSG